MRQTESSYESLSENVRQPRIFCLQVSGEIVKFIGFVVFVILVTIKFQAGLDWSWAGVFSVLWITDGLAIVLFIMALVEQIPYIRQLVRLGIPRIGDNPSATEMVGISAKISAKMIITALFVWFEVNLARYLNGSGAGLGIVGIPLYVVQVLGLVYAILIIDFSVQVCALDLFSVVFYLLAMLKFEFHVVRSIWVVFAPVFSMLSIIFVGLLYRRVYSQSIWDFRRKICWWGVLLGSFCFILFACLFCAKISSLESGIDFDEFARLTPMAIALPLFIGMCFWSIPISFYAKDFLDPILISRDYFELSQIQADEEASLIMKNRITHNFDDFSEEESLMIEGRSRS